MRRFLTAGLLCLVLFVGAVRGQPTKTGPLAPPQPQTATDTSSGESPSAVPWVAAVLFTIVILSIVCMPSRKN